jgi:hypothetical protein
MKRRALLATCLLISLSVHLFFLLFLEKTPFLISNHLSSLFRKSSPALELVKADSDVLERQKELEEVFEEFIAAEQKIPFDSLYLPSASSKPPGEETIASLPVPSHESVELNELNLSSSIIPPELSPLLALSTEVQHEGEKGEDIPTQIDFEKKQSEDHSKALTASALALDPVEESDDAGLDSIPASSARPSELPSYSVVESFLKESPKEDSKGDSLPQIKMPVLLAVKEAVPPLVFPKSSALDLEGGQLLSFSKKETLSELDAYLFPEVAQAVSWDDAFEVKVELMPNTEGEGYVFAINLVPTDEIYMEQIPQNFYFLIDRSSSIERHRFAAYKRAVIKALSCLKENDKFNILLFDKKVKRLSEKPLVFNRTTLHKAEEFLESQEHGGIFASADLYASLDKVIPTDLSPDEVHTAILITDGESSQKPAKQKKNISEWLEKNAGQVCLYTAAVGKGNNLIMLDLLSTLSGGQLLYSDTHAAFPRRLGKLLLNLRNPLMKDIGATAYSKDSDAEILFYPSSANLPNLFSKRPYEIMGTINHLTDFTLILQGRHKGQWVSITKEISLSGKARPTRLLEKRWTAMKAKSEYGTFLKEGKVTHLIKAKELLKTAGSEIALQ